MRDGYQDPRPDGHWHGDMVDGPRLPGEPRPTRVPPREHRGPPGADHRPWTGRAWTTNTAGQLHPGDFFPEPHDSWGGVVPAPTATTAAVWDGVHAAASAAETRTEAATPRSGRENRGVRARQRAKRCSSLALEKRVKEV